jgi:hypothetical protein
MNIIDRLYKFVPATFPRFHLSIERWKFNEEYKIWVSTHGNVMDEEKNLIIAKTTNKKYMVCQVKDRLFAVHRLVMLTWRPREDAKTLTVDHLNSNPRDNRLVNLEWVTIEENHRRALENHIENPLTEEEEEKKVQKVIEKKTTNFTKEQIIDIKLTELTERFLEGTVWLNHAGFILNKDNFIKFATSKNGAPAGMRRQDLARRFIKAGFSCGSYCGCSWKLGGSVEVDLRKV